MSHMPVFGVSTCQHQIPRSGSGKAAVVEAAWRCQIEMWLALKGTRHIFGLCLLMLYPKNKQSYQTLVDNVGHKQFTVLI